MLAQKILRFAMRQRAGSCCMSSAAAAVREPKDLHAAWASLAAYDSRAAGRFLNGEAENAKALLRGAGFELSCEFVVQGGKSMSFDNTHEVEETDAAYLWQRETDGTSILAFRGSDTQQVCDKPQESIFRCLRGILSLRVLPGENLRRVHYLHSFLSK